MTLAGVRLDSPGFVDAPGGGRKRGWDETFAAADRPTVYGPFTFTFTDVDPCTGLLHDITFNTTFYDHEGHPNNFVGRAVLTGSTTAGYELVGGHSNFRENKNGVSSSFKDVWWNPNGNKMQASGKFRVVGNSMIVDTFELRCVGGPTILP